MFDEIINALESNPESFQFCTSIVRDTKNIGLRVDGVGHLRFPIEEKLAQKLIKISQPAQFGKREKTLSDRKVRDTWEISESKIHLESVSWNNLLQTVLEKVKSDLGLPEHGTLTAHLHNMLVYENGQHFKTHQDSEKIDNMVATLVVLLPSKFSGGNLVVDQRGNKKTFKSANSATEATFVAFYADCHHEVKKVTDGYRIALTYNLSFKVTSKKLPEISNSRLTTAIEKYFSENDRTNGTLKTQSPCWLVYLLDHDYTQKGLSWQGLKGIDRLRASSMLSSASSLGLEAHLTLADIHETWSANEDDNSWGGYDYDDEDDEDMDYNSSSGDYELQEIIESSCELRHWVYSSGKVVKLKNQTVDMDSICWTKAVNDGVPFETNYEPYMGNYGNTLDRWYHRAAIVLWKSESEYASLFKNNPIDTSKKIISLMKKNLQAGLAALKQTLPQWSDYLLRNDEIHPLAFEVAILAKDLNITSKIISPLGFDSLSRKSHGHLISLCKIHGESWLMYLFKDWKKEEATHFHSSAIQDLAILIRLLTNYPEAQSFILENELSKKLKDDKSELDSSTSELRTSQKDRFSTAFELLNAGFEANNNEILSKFVKHIIDNERLYPSLSFSEGLLKIKNNQLKNNKYLNDLIKTLRERISKMVTNARKSGDWSIMEKPNCTCSDCRVLEKFLQDKNLKTKQWPLAKDRRRHLHQIIDGMDIYVDHDTNRKGSPFTLVLSKLDTLFNSEQKIKETAKKTLQLLENL